jgi:hypothetical protein
MEACLNSPYIVPLGGMALAAIIVSVAVWGKTRQKEIQMEHDLRLRQMEHERRLQELELEKLKLGKGPEA